MEQYSNHPAVRIPLVLLSVLTLAMLPGACTDLSDYDRDRVSDAVSDSLVSVTESWNISMDLIEDGLRTVRVTAPYAATFSRDGETETELEGEVHVAVFDTAGTVTTTVHSKAARYIGSRSEFHFLSDVIVNTDDDRTLYTDYLEWSQRNRSIHTPEFVIIVTPSDSITGYGLEGTDDLASYVLTEVTGEFDLEQSQP
ncbi:LPS export ABC transporter periplasmic protein LptC [Balneolales bacterium ANBcel1]|nr:LPS export ABC transporter periplasmic protein LptC [Balneolales bacterium ANBcel1]